MAPLNGEQAPRRSVNNVKVILQLENHNSELINQMIYGWFHVPWPSNRPGPMLLRYLLSLGLIYSLVSS